jgi:GNAT superfamily N-acetyltransferase
VSYEIRRLREDEWDQCLDLLAEVMDANRGYFSDSFKRDRGGWQSMVVVVDGEIASHIRIFESQRHVGDCRIRSAEIGDVCTHPRHRGRGYMTAFLNHAVSQLYLQGFDISTVYSGVFIYAKAGWVAFPEPDQYLLWRLINLRSLLARTSPVFQARAAGLADACQGVVAISCLGQHGFLEFGPNGCRSLDHCAKPDMHLDLDQLTFFRLLVGRDTPSELELPGRLGLSTRESEVVEALFPKARPRF